MGRAPCCNEAAGLKKGSWTADEDQKLIAYIQEHGEGGWRALPQKAGLQRCGKSCRLRWFNYLRPDIKRGKLSTEEEQMIIRLHSTLGNRWSAIAKHLPKRTDNEIKNHWNTYLKKRSPQTPIDPNNLAAKLVAPSRCLDALETSHTDGGSVNSDVIDKDSPSSTMSRPVSTSARLLNKMATRLSSPFYCLDTLKSILSMSTDREGNGIEANDNYLQPSASASSLSSRSNGVASDQMATTDDSLAPVTNIFDVDIFRDLYVSAYDYNMESPVYNYPLGNSSCDKSTELLI